jgi:hypothetical protein
MTTAEPHAGVAPDLPAIGAAPHAEVFAGDGGRPGGRRGTAWLVLSLLLVGAFALRVWGIGQGLPYAYNADEAAHFVPRAIGMFVLGYNPRYFANPPAFTYLLHLVFAVWFGGRAGVSHTFAVNPTAVFVLARATVALLGTLAVWLLYLAGTRLFDRGVALLAAALEAVAFLPVFYAHLALNDVPTLVGLTLSLLGVAGVLRRGRLRDYLVAGVGLGLGCATKYTAGIVLAPLLAAAAAQYLGPARSEIGGPADRSKNGGTAAGGHGRVLAGLAVAGIAALAAFLVANPYAALDLHAFREGIVHQSTVSDEAQGKLGAPHESGIGYYLWSFTWGLGWVPALAALGGAVTVWWRERALGWVLVPAPLLYLAFMGAQGRYFGRWLLPIFPIVCLLAALFALQLAGVLTRRAAPRLHSVAVVVAVLALCGQGLLYSVHSDLVLSRADTRNLTRAWMEAHVPVGALVVVEPVVPDGWVQDVGHPTLTTRNGNRWIKYPSLVSVIDPTGVLDLRRPMAVTIEDYERTLSPALIGYYEREGYCWVLSGFTQSGRAFANPGEAPQAVAYYRALRGAGQVVYHITPYHPGSGPVGFNFDWTFDYYPLAYERPGPEMTVYRLHGGRCAGGLS